MELFEIMKKRHSVRQYQNKKIETPLRNQLDELTAKLNQESGLHIQIIYDDPECFNSMMAHYGKFSGVENYIALVGKKAPDFDEKCGYYGEQIVLKAQELGLNTCWVASTYGKGRCKARTAKNEKLLCVIALGYGATQGKSRPSKSISEVSNASAQAPDWFRQGVEAALLAPTAINQQKFYFELAGDQVKARVKGLSLYTKLDLGIVKYHFEAISGHKAE